MKSMLATAIKLAAERHSEQYDKGGNPYILHVLKVMHYVRTNDEELNCIAVLHDIVEDTATTYAELIELGFSERVINGIRRVTKVPGESIEEYQQKVISSTDSMRVKMSDLRHNMDIRRLKGLRPKDMERLAYYAKFYSRIEEEMKNV